MHVKDLKLSVKHVSRVTNKSGLAGSEELPGVEICSCKTRAVQATWDKLVILYVGAKYVVVIKSWATATGMEV